MSSTAPGIVPLSMSALSVSVMSWRRLEDSPTLSGGEVGSGSASAEKEAKRTRRSVENPRRRLIVRFPFDSLVGWGEPATARRPRKGRTSRLQRRAHMTGSGVVNLKEGG